MALFGSFLEELEARTAIEDCLKRFARAVDRQDWKAAIETPLFHKAKSTFVINTTNYELSPSLTL